MNRLARILLTVLALALTTSAARADWGSLCYGGYQPWWNIFAHRNHYQTTEEKRLQRFWHDYYDAQSRYYHGLEHIDWVAYYKNHGYRINGGGCGAGGCGDGPVQFAPVAVTPAMQWASPTGASCAPPMGPSCGPMGCPGPSCGPMGCGPMGPGGPPMGGMPMGGMPMGGMPMGGMPMGAMGPMGPGGPVAPAGYGYSPAMGYGYAPGMGMPMPVMPAGYYSYPQQ